MKKRALIAMSGGVDSSVAAHLMLQRGYECAGATMRLFENADIAEPPEKTCCSLRDVDDARSVALKLGIDFHVFNFADEFREQIMGRFIDSYRRGETPNPCIDCNRYMKFEKFLQRAELLGFDCVVTGHYARVEFDSASGRYLLKKGADLSKDQSYVLYCMTQEQLARTIFPLGELAKSEIRAIAAAQGLINADKRDSQDICFVPDGDYAAFIERQTGTVFPEGDFLDESGRVIGRHRGIIRYTVGQRKGLGVISPEPLYVCAKNAADNTVTLCRNGSNSGLFSDSLIAADFNWIAAPPSVGEEFRATAKIRYNQSEQLATVVRNADESVTIRFDSPQRAIAPGQAAVVYDGEIVVGGGRISGGIF